MVTYNPITKTELLSTTSLAEAITRFFHLDLEGRLCIFDREAMEGKVALAYNALGLASRRATYQNIAEDFKLRTSYTDHFQPRRKILEIGCGSGLLTLALAEHTHAMVFGLDISADMITLANDNKTNRGEEIIKNIIKEYEDGGCNFFLPIPAALDPMPDIVDTATYVTNRAKFIHGNVYDLTRLAQNKPCIDYVACRNALHRFRDPQEALCQMYSVLKEGGKIYLRDLRRDADWKTVVERIGEARWKTPALVRDYLGAMAAMLTTQELEKILRALNINTFTITDGSYEPNVRTNNLDLKEYEQATEYVCVIEKSYLFSSLLI